MDSASYLLALAYLRAGDVAAGQAGLERVASTSQNVMLRDVARSKLALLQRTAAGPSSAP